MAQLLSNESELIARLKSGDEAAFEAFFRDNAGIAMSVARRFFGDTEDAADAVQEAFVSAFKAIGSFQESSRLGTWLHRITTNCCLMRIRNKKRRATLQLTETTMKASYHDRDLMSRNEICTQVRRGISRLPKDYRTVIQYRDLEGLDTAETAARLGTTEAVVKTRLHRARQALRIVLEPMGSLIDD